MKTREYKAIKNFVHNELGLTKEKFIELLKEAIKDEAKSFVNRKFQKDEDSLNRVATESIKAEIYNTINGRTWNTQRDKFFEGLGKEVAKNIKIK